MTIRQDYRFTIYDKPTRKELPIGKVRSDGTCYGTVKTSYGFTGLDASVYQVISPTGAADAPWLQVGSDLYTGTCLYYTGMFGSYSGTNQIIDCHFDPSHVGASGADHGEYYGLQFRTDSSDDSQTLKFSPDLIIKIEDDINDLGITGTSTPNVYQGPQGETGLPRAAGATGAQGYTGLDGGFVAQGYTGVQGETGSQGETGAQGFTGVQGETGTQGAQGFTGVQGETGLQGIDGEEG